jgi:hypothetical protein
VSVSLTETAESREFTIDAQGARGAWKYVGIVAGEADPEAALELAVRNAAPFFWEGLARQSITATPHGGGVYSVEVPYAIEKPNTAAQDPTASPGPTDGPGGGAPSGTPTGPASDSEAVGAEHTLEVGGRPPKLLTSLATLASGALGGGVAPDFKRAINVSQKGEVEGVEIDDAAIVWTVSKDFDFITWGYFKLLVSLLWKTNSNTSWYRYGRREVAFMGATLKQGKDGRWNATFRFGLKPTTTIAAGKFRDDGANKLPQASFTFRGWDHLWIKFEEEVDAAVNMQLSRPKYYFVEQVLEEADFAQFGIGS